MEKSKLGNLISLAQESGKSFNTSAIRSSDQPPIMIRTPPGLIEELNASNLVNGLLQNHSPIDSFLEAKLWRVVSLWTCTKFSAISFGVGVVVGFMLKRRVRRWAAKLLKRIKDD